MALGFRSPVTKPLMPWTGRCTGPTPMRRCNDPASFEVTSPYAPRPDGFHTGLDIGNGHLGDTIVAVAAGTVIAAGYLKEPWSQSTNLWPSGNYGGLMVVIQHTPGILSIYAHMIDGSLTVGPGPVSAGQIVGRIGDTGSAAGQGHLHFGIADERQRANGHEGWVDPWPLVNGGMLGVPSSGEVDMRFGGADLKQEFRQFKTLTAARFRAAPTLSAPIYTEFRAGTTIFAGPRVRGDLANGSDQWWVAWMYVDGAYRVGVFHASVLTPVS